MRVKGRIWVKVAKTAGREAIINIGVNATIMVNNSSKSEWSLPVLRRREAMAYTLGGLGLLSSTGSVSGLGSDASGEDTDTVEVVARLSDLGVIFDQDGPASASNKNLHPVDNKKSQISTSQVAFRDQAESTDGVTIKRTFWLIEAAVLEIDLSKADIDDIAGWRVVERIHRNFSIEAPEPDQTDTDEDGNVTYGLDQINAPDVWETYDTRGVGVRVAVLDTGIDISHPDLELVRDDPDDPTYPGGFAEFDLTGTEVEGSEPRDDTGHGTHVSGTVAGGDESGTSIGVAPDVDLMHGLVLPGGAGTFASIVAGIEWALENDADVINMSIGGAERAPEFIEPIEEARDLGVTVVVSAGNTGEGSSSTPGNLFSELNVGAVNDSREVAEFSSGEEIDTNEAWGDDAPDYYPDEYIVPRVSAPGVGVLSAFPTDDGEPEYAELSGTSMAAPHVAGSLALGISASSERPPETLIDTAESNVNRPDTDDDFPNIRFGSGIIDTKAIVDELVDAGGVTGKITDSEGNPIQDATISPVELSVRTQTDESGEYELFLDDGSYEIEVTAFGFETVTESVTVEDGSFVTLDISLDDVINANVVQNQPDSIGAGESIEVIVEVANLQSVTVSRGEEYTIDDETLLVDGDEAELGTPVEFDDEVSGNVSIELEVPDGQSGEVVLEHTLEGVGGEITITTGPTTVFDEVRLVGVIGMPSDTGGTIPSQSFRDELRDQLPDSFDIELTSTDFVIDNPNTYDTVVVHTFREERDPEVHREFKAVTSENDTGVVYIQGLNFQSNGIIKHIESAGYPVDPTFLNLVFGGPFKMQINRPHPIFDGVFQRPNFPETIDIYSPPDVFSTASFFEGYPGPVLGEIGTEGFFRFTVEGKGIMIDDVKQSVYLSSVGHQFNPRTGAVVDGQFFSEEIRTIIANAVRWTSEDPILSIVSTEPDEITPDDEYTVNIELEASGELTVQLNDESYERDRNIDYQFNSVSADDVSVSVNDQQVNLGESVQVDEGTMDIRVDPDSDVLGNITLDIEFETESGTQIEGIIGPTSVYERPVVAGEDTESIQEAIDTVTHDGEVVLQDEVYREEIIINPAGNDGMTIESANDADPIIVTPNNTLGRAIIPTVDIQSARVEFSGISIFAGDEAAGGIRIRGVGRGGGLAENTVIRNLSIDVFGSDIVTPVGVDTSGPGGVGNGDGARIENVTVEDVIGGNITGIEAVNNVEIDSCEIVGAAEGVDLGIFGSDGDTAIENTTIAADTGILVEGAGNILIASENTITDSEVGIRVGNGAAAETITDNSISNSETGIEFFGDGGIRSHADTIENNEISATDEGIKLNGFVSAREISSNNITDAETGISIESEFSQFDDEFERPLISQITSNSIQSQTGFSFDSVAHPTIEAIRQNNLEETELPFEAGDDVTIDARANYIGDREFSETITTGNVLYEPFLLSSPEEIEESPPTDLAVDLKLHPEEEYSVGIPGPTDQTIWSVLGVDSAGEFDGTLEYWDADNEEFVEFAGDVDVTHIDTMDAYRITPETGVRALVDFQQRDLDGDNRSGQGRDEEEEDEEDEEDDPIDEPGPSGADNRDNGIGRGIGVNDRDGDSRGDRGRDGDSEDDDDDRNESDGRDPDDGSGGRQDDGRDDDSDDEDDDDDESEDRQGQGRGDRPDFFRDPTPGTVELQSGRNFISAPVYAPADLAFDNDDIVEVSTADLKEPDSQIGSKGELEGSHNLNNGSDGPALSAFTGYFVESESSVTIDAGITDFDPTATDVTDGLNIEFDQQEVSFETIEDLVDQPRMSEEQVQELAEHIAELASEVADDEKKIASITYEAVMNQARHLPHSVVSDITEQALNSVADIQE